MKPFRFISRILLAGLFLSFSSTGLALGDIKSDKISSSINGPGPGGYFRIYIANDSANWNYSILPAGPDQNFVSVLPPCQLVDDSECISSVQYRKKGAETWLDGKISSQQAPNMNGVIAYSNSSIGVTAFYGEVQKNIMRKIPHGTQTTYWELDQAKHAGGSNYLVNVSISDMTDGIAKDKYTLKVNLRPAKLNNTPHNFYYDKLYDYSDEFNFPTGFEYKIELKLGFLDSKITNWYSGRITNPSIVKNESNLTIYGEPTLSPVVTTDYELCSNLSGNKLRILQQTFGQNILATPVCSDPSGGSFSLAVINNNALAIFSEWESQFRELGKNSSWNIQSTGDLSNCESEGMSGFVTSNATLYTPYPPIYNTTEKSLTYQLASTHFDTEGKINVGRFNLVIKSSTAECLWGVEPNLLNNAGIQITYADGLPIIGTTTISSKNGWTYLNIENFSFSSPKFKIFPKAVLSGHAQTPLVFESATANVIPLAKMRKTTIICIKAGRTKKVVGVQPKCPIGYKKK